MSINYGYYLPLSEDLFTTVRFIDITEKPDGIGTDARQAHDKEGTPRWVVSALVRLGDHKQETETFTLTAPLSVAQEIDTMRFSHQEWRRSSLVQFE